MDTEKCKALLTAIKKGSITAAANELGYTISGISKMIVSLENEFEFSLIHRGKKGVSPTEECLRVIPYMKKILIEEEMCNQMKAQIKGVYQGKVRFGTSCDTLYGKIAGIIAEFSSKYPDIEIELIEKTSTELYQLLELGEIDICLASKREGKVDYIPIGRDEIVIWLPKNHEMIENGQYLLKDLEKESYIEIHPGKETDNSKILNYNRIVVHSRYATSDVGAALSMVEAGLGVAMVNNLLTKKLSGNVLTAHFLPPQYVEIGIASLMELGPAASCFKDYLLSSYIPI